MGLAGAYSVSGQTMTCNTMMGDTVEGIDAFLGKRAPNWKH
jgi:1,4-dihydroxy-2-naphthoyl-CoA synthase